MTSDAPTPWGQKNEVSQALLPSHVFLLNFLKAATSRASWRFCLALSFPARLPFFLILFSQLSSSKQTLCSSTNQKIICFETTRKGEQNTNKISIQHSFKYVSTLPSFDLTVIHFYTHTLFLWKLMHRHIQSRCFSLDGNKVTIKFIRYT